MAEKKVKDPEIVERESDLEEVFIPPEGKGDTERFIAVNGRRILVQTGKRIMVPKMFAEVIRNSQEQDRAAQAYIAAMMQE